MNHLTLENALAYIAGKVTEEESFQIETHLADCDECARRVYSYNIIKENFDEIWDSWTAKEHAVALFQARFLEALEKAKVPPRLDQRIKAWAKKVSQKTETVLDIILDFRDKTAKIFQEGLERFCQPGIGLTFLPAPVPSWITGEAREASISVEAQGPPWVKVTVDPSVRKIAVQAEILKKRWPLIILLPKAKGKAIIGEFHQPVDTDYILSEFEDVPDGKYFLMLEARDIDEK